MTRRYSELIQHSTFEERFRYLRLFGRVGDETFGTERFLNQRFYRSREWKHIRQVVIARDEGFDLGIPGREIYDRILIHHMVPITVRDLEDGNGAILDPEYLISVSHPTHNAIHYGDERQLPRPFEPRQSGDTSLWSRSRR